MKCCTPNLRVSVRLSAVFALVVGVQGGTITLSPSNPTVLVGQTLQLTASGAVVPTAIYTGAWHTCLLYSDQSIRCTGLNNQGEIGNNSYLNVSEPALAIGTVNPAALRIGNEHTCTLVADGRMQCWGSNYTGQLGDGTFGGFAEQPQFVHNISTAIKAVPGGYHTCAILSDHSVQCWGRNQDGQVGNGDSTTDVGLPTPVIGLGPGSVADLFAGGYHTCAVMSDTTVQCWGRNARGQVGDGTVNTPITQPHRVSGLSGVALVAGGGYHTCGLLQNSTVDCWGQSDYGQIGATGLAFSSTPVAVNGLGSVTLLATGGWHSCAASSDGTMRCWGRNDLGELGDGTTTSSANAVVVQGITNPRAIAAGWGHTCALLQDSSVRCWGENDFGELGIGTMSPYSPTPVTMHLTGLAWTSSNPSVATVNSAGVVTGVGRGTATITVADPFGNSGSAAVTVKQMLTLSVLRQGDGGGTVTSAPIGVSCPSTCSANFVSDSPVTLTAAPAADSLFTGWTGCDAVSGATCTVSMANSTSVTAIFMLKRFTLSVTKSDIGQGTVTSSPAGINCGNACASDFVIHTTVTLTANPAMLSIFNGWTGCDATNGSTCTVVMNAPRSVNADFIGISLP
jgi:alpha-tubulin suppressor-like RCC1 family protein